MNEKTYTPKIPDADDVSIILQKLASDPRYGDEAYARAKQRLKSLEKTEKIIKAEIVVGLKGKENATSAGNIAYHDDRYRQWEKNHTDAVYDLALIEARRANWENWFEFWRSVNSARKQGAVV